MYSLYFSMPASESRVGQIVSPVGSHTKPYDDVMHSCSHELIFATSAPTTRQIAIPHIKVSDIPNASKIKVYDLITPRPRNKPDFSRCPSAAQRSRFYQFRLSTFLFQSTRTSSNRPNFELRYFRGARTLTLGSYPIAIVPQCFSDPIHATSAGSHRAAGHEQPSVGTLACLQQER